MKRRTVLYAEEGKILTDGDIYGKTIFLADDKNAEDFYEIGEDVYNNILSEAKVNAGNAE